MRIPRTWIAPMARRIADTLLGEQMVVRDIEPAALASAIEPIILEELMVEDRLGEEVRRMLGDHDRNIDGSKMDYRRLFELTRKKLAEERGLIL